MILSSSSKRRGMTLAGVFSLAFSSVLLFCGAGSVPVENLLPQGAMQGDLNAGGHNLTNVAAVNAANLTVSGTLTAPSSFTLPYAQVTGTPSLATVATSGAYNDLTGKPTLGPLASISPGGTPASGTFLKFDGTTYSYAAPSGAASTGTSLLYGNGSGGFSNATVGGGLAFSGGALSANVTSVAGRAGAIALSASDISGLSTVAATGAYSSLTGAPTIPTTTSQLTNNSGFITSAPVTSVAGRTGAIVLSASDISDLGSAATQASSSFDASGAASAAQTAAETYSSNAGNSSSGNLPVARLSLFLNAANTFTQPQTLPGWWQPTGPSGGYVVGSGDSRLTTGNLNDTSYKAQTVNSSLSAYALTGTYVCSTGMLGDFLGDLQNGGFFSNMYGFNWGLSGTGIQDAIVAYTQNEVATTGNITSGSNTVTITGSTSGIGGNMFVSGPGIRIGTTVSSISGSTVTLGDYLGSSRTPTATTSGATLVFSPLYPTYAQYPPASGTLNPGPTMHMLSPAVSGVTGSFLISEGGVNDTIVRVFNNGTCSTSSYVVTGLNDTSSISALPYVGEAVSGTNIPANTTITAVSHPTNYNGSVTVTLSNYPTSSVSGSESLTFTPVASAWITQYQSFVNTAVSNGYNVEVMTLPKAWGSALISGDSVRQAYNALLVSTYGTSPPSGVQLCDVSSGLSAYWAANATQVYQDGTHMTLPMFATEANYLSNACFNQWTALQGLPFYFGPGSMAANSGIVPSANYLMVGPSTTGSQDVGGFESGGSSTEMHIGTSYLIDNGSYLIYNNQAQIPRGISGTVPVIPSSATTVSGSSSGTIVCSEPFNEATCKKVMIYCNGLTGSASYTFPTAFVTTPVVMTTSGPATSLVTTLSPTGATVTGSSTTGPLVLEGY
jgi:hypothetical protein